MLIHVLTYTESIVLYIFLLMSLFFSYGFVKKRKTYISITILWIILFTVCYKPVETYAHSFLAYWIYMFLFAGSYSLFQKESQWNKLIFIFTYICTIVCIKSFILCLIGAHSFSQTQNTLQIVLLYIAFYFLCFVSTIFFIKHPLILLPQLPTKYFAFMILIPSVIVVIVIFENLLLYNSNPNRIISSLLFLFLLFIVIGVYYLIVLLSNIYMKMMTSNTINQRLKMENGNLLSSYAMIKQIRREKHELKNHYFYISSLVKSKKYQELDHFLCTELGVRYDAMEQIRTGNHLVDFLLTQKLIEAREQHIHVITNIILPADLPIKEDDLCSLLLNLLNNAIEASKREENPVIHIIISVVKNYLQIHIKNKSSEDILLKNPRLLTTKKDANTHGFGIQIIQSIVDNYSGMITFKMEGEYFSVITMLQL